MRIKKIGAILAGAVMIGSAIAAAWAPSENRDFFVDPSTGQPNSVIVVGTNAAAGDVTAAGWIAAQIGSMCYWEEEIPQYFEDTWKSPKVIAPTLFNQALVGDNRGCFPGREVLSTLWWQDAEATPDGILDANEPYEVIILNLKGNPTTGSIGTFHYVCNADGMDGTATPMIHFLGYNYTPLKWLGGGTPATPSDDAVLCANTFRDPNAKFYMDSTTINGWTLNMDISEAFWGQWNKLDLIVADPAGGVHEKLLTPTGFPGSWASHRMIVKYSPSKDKYYLMGVDSTAGVTDLVKVFKFVYNGCFLGQKSTFVLGDVEASSGLETISNAYCIRPSGMGGPEFNMIVKPNKKEICLDFVTMPGYMGSPYYVPYMTIPVAPFDPKEAETFWCNDDPEDPYFTVNLTFDYVYPSNPATSWYINQVTVHQAFELEPKTVIHPVTIDPTELVLEDTYVVVNPVVKSMKNLILVGGPGLVTQGVGPDGETFAICNAITKDLVDEGKSTVDWFMSPGEYEYIKDAFTDGKDVVIVAGADRIGTKLAVKKLLEDLNA